MVFRDLEKVRRIIDEATGLEISYAYEDLVFPDNTAFIIQFDDNNNTNIFCSFHEDCNANDQIKIFEELKKAAKNNDFTISAIGSFKLSQEGEEVKIHFNN